MEKSRMDSSEFVRLFPYEQFRGRREFLESQLAQAADMASLSPLDRRQYAGVLRRREVDRDIAQLEKRFPDHNIRYKNETPEENQ